MDSDIAELQKRQLHTYMLWNEVLNNSGIPQDVSRLVVDLGLNIKASAQSVKGAQADLSSSDEHTKLDAASHKRYMVYAGAAVAIALSIGLAVYVCRNTTTLQMICDKFSNGLPDTGWQYCER